jgi:putative phage-type endonuclease
MTDNQRTPEWFAARLGKVTASRVADVVARTKTGYGASRANYMAELLVERLTGQQADGYESPAMRWGTEQEPFARSAYEFHRDTDVTTVGFIGHPTVPMSGASPDGLVGDTGLVEFKCPNTATHIETLLAGSIPQKYIDQMQWQMACTGCQWADFASFDPRLPESMRLWVERVPRDEKRIGELEAEVVKFLAELDSKLAALRAAYEPQQEAA